MKPMKPVVAYVAIIDRYLHDLYTTRRMAIALIEAVTREPWSTAKSHCEVVKCLISPIAKKPRKAPSTPSGA